VKMQNLDVKFQDEQGHPVSVSIHEEYMVLYTTLKFTSAVRNARGDFVPNMGVLTYTLADPKTVDPLSPPPM
jgi:hypothetical protein